MEKQLQCLERKKHDTNFLSTIVYNNWAKKTIKTFYKNIFMFFKEGLEENLPKYKKVIFPLRSGTAHNFSSFHISVFFPNFL